ncbi:MAG: antibiotic biosynthesis monooxygenase [Bacteroidales bacterium]|nr:antibiotic biosynthesis monooxygenase [Bacteroidales bacterium]
MAIAVVTGACCSSGNKKEAACTKSGDEKSCCTKSAIPADALKIVATAVIKDAALHDEVLAALKACVDGTRKEEGNISYELHQDINDPLTYIFIEVWKSPEAIATHNETPHFKALIQAIDGKVDLTATTVKKVY